MEIIYDLLNDSKMYNLVFIHFVEDRGALSTQHWPTYLSGQAAKVRAPARGPLEDTRSFNKINYLNTTFSVMFLLFLILFVN